MWSLGRFQSICNHGNAPWFHGHSSGCSSSLWCKALKAIIWVLDLLMSWQGCREMLYFSFKATAYIYIYILTSSSALLEIHCRPLSVMIHFLIVSFLSFKSWPNATLILSVAVALSWGAHPIRFTLRSVSKIMAAPKGVSDPFVWLLIVIVSIIVHPSFYRWWNIICFLKAAVCGW